jgi:hypothetical protein
MVGNILAAVALAGDSRYGLIVHDLNLPVCDRVLNVLRLLTQKPNTFAQICRSTHAFSLQSDGGPYISGKYGTPLVRQADFSAT